MRQFIKITHEVPVSMFKYERIFNDFPYLLSHLLIKSSPHFNQEYYDYYKERVKGAEYSILDNSCYELGKPVNNKDYLKVIDEFKPTHIILPDFPFDGEKTIQYSLDFYGSYFADREDRQRYKFIGVLHGRDLAGYVNCLKEFTKMPFVDTIGLNVSPREDFSDYLRPHILAYILKNQSQFKKKIHFLGVFNIGELQKYSRAERELIFSLDTSAPIMCGANGIDFATTKKYQKPKEKIADNMGMVFDTACENLILKNIRTFRSII